MPARVALAVFLLALAPGLAHGGYLTVAGDPGDGLVDVNGVPVNLSDPDLRPGTGGNVVRGQAAIYFFSLPTLDHGATITAATLNLGYLGVYVDSIPSIPEFRLDLFGVGARATPTILASDYHDGPAGTSSDVLIRDDFITPATPAGPLAASDAAVGQFLQSLYGPAGTPAAAYAVFRVSPDKDLPPNSGLRRGYLVATADHPDGSLRPTLGLAVTTVPAPAGLVLGGIGVLSLFGYGGLRRKITTA